MELSAGSVGDGSGTFGALVACVCSSCERAWLGVPESPCAGCHDGRLVTHPSRLFGSPELALPFAIDAAAAAKAVSAWVARAPLPVEDANQASSRLVPYFVPVWMVDARVTARWEAEAGFDYPVQSTVERWIQGRWQSVPVEETRIRWEHRAGTIDRWYDNQAVGALTGCEAPEVSGAGAERPVEIHPVLLPTRLPRDAWPEAESRLMARVEADLARASRAQQIREVYLDARWEEHNWTWLLVPMWSAWFRDEEGRIHVLQVDAGAGDVTGVVVSSASRAARRATLWVGFGLVCLVCAVVVALPGIVLWPLLLLTALLAVLGFAALSFALVPLARTRAWNAKKAAT